MQIFFCFQNPLLYTLGGLYLPSQNQSVCKYLRTLSRWSNTLICYSRNVASAVVILAQLFINEKDLFMFIQNCSDQDPWSRLVSQWWVWFEFLHRNILIENFFKSSIKKLTGQKSCVEESS